MAFEAWWDGDTQGWIVAPAAVLAEPSDDVGPALWRHGERERDKAGRTGRRLGERFGVPFHFASPAVPGVGLPRWWDGRR
ncbi:hypothetical protein [Streptomyces sp. RKAG290]|uniref:hypothetical protein n=1 Tax=Streptomyces sp. RKAG290 TaxID=2888348 RepID=UPI0020335E15|nr:hypothetical protein [Streptomyces sp. RKAG290]MCM2414767.1 hypothetical protein [Streptomyces sp. RKAG290]